MRPEPPPPTIRLRVDGDALAGNWRALDTMSGTAQTGAAVKADCYGLGVDACVPTLRDVGCKHFFVAHWSEVEAVAAHVDPAQIAVLHGPVSLADVVYAKGVGALPVINSLAQARRWSASGGGPCHLMIDTGINRLGVTLSELADPAIQALDVDVVMSHLAGADEGDLSSSTRQLDLFRSALPQISYRAASLANSAGIALGPNYAFDLTRPGLALYGGVPRPELAGKLRQVAHVEAAILQTRTIEPGDAIGYNGAFVADRTLQVATVSLGYADGFLRSRGAGGCLLRDDAKLPVLGKVSMDMVVVDLTDVPELREGDWLTVPFDLPDIAQQSALSQYELLTTLGHRMRTR